MNHLKVSKAMNSNLMQSPTCFPRMLLHENLTECCATRLRLVKDLSVQVEVLDHRVSIWLEAQCIDECWSELVFPSPRADHAFVVTFRADAGFSAICICQPRTSCFSRHGALHSLTILENVSVSGEQGKVGFNYLVKTKYETGITMCTLRTTGPH